MDNTTGQELAFRKNEFYRNAYRRTMKWLVFSSLIGACLALILAWMTYDRQQPAYYAAATTGEVLPLHSLSEPVITSVFIVQWSALTVQYIFNLSFDTYQQQLAAAKPSFTPDGWASMSRALQSSGLLKNLVTEKLIMSAVISGTPIIIARMIVHGRYTWRVQMPVLIKFRSASAETQRHFLITMNVQRMPTLDTSQGIQVVDFAAAPAQ